MTAVEKKNEIELEEGAIRINRFFTEIFFIENFSIDSVFNFVFIVWAFGPVSWPSSKTLSGEVQCGKKNSINPDTPEEADEGNEADMPKSVEYLQYISVFILLVLDGLLIAVILIVERVKTVDIGI